MQYHNVVKMTKTHETVTSQRQSLAQRNFCCGKRKGRLL
jgi:hypothetical protein